MNRADNPVFDALFREFGDNAEFALELYTRYRVDAGSVDREWRTAFERLETSVAVMGKTAPLAAPAPVAPAPPAPVRAVPAPARPPLPAPRAGEEPVPMTGGAATLARNMEASLGVPTATSNRVIPVKTMEENRRILNRHREVQGTAKISFTHLVAWAILRAVEQHPGMNDAYGETDGKPIRVRKPKVNLGIAIDVARRDGSRALFVPNVKGADKLNFADFLTAFDTMVAKSRKGTIEPDSFQGTSITLTNPGTLGTTASAPRLMPGQGTIIATGAMGYPPEFQAMPDEVIGALGISRVMNVSSTYDHRVIQGAESGAFLATVQDLLLGKSSFYEGIFADLKVPHRPVVWQKDSNPPFFGGARNLESIEKQARVLQLINAYRVRGHLISDLDPLGHDTIPYHPELDPATYDFTLWDLDRTFITNGLAGTHHATLREILEVLRQTYCGKIAAEFMYIQDPDQKRWIRERMESSRNRASLSPEDQHRVLTKLIEAESFEKFLHTKYVGHKRFSLEGGEAAIPLLTRLLDRAAEMGVEEAVLGMPHRGRLTVLATIVNKPVAKIFSEFEDVEDPNSIQGSGDVKYHLGAAGAHQAPSGQKIRVVLAPNPSHLEFVNPVVEGMVRAKQDRMGDVQREKVIPILLHGDAAFAGQGIVAETLNMSQLEGYRTGGTVHVIVNNQIGFTTNPADARSSPYCTDVAKMIQAPVLHVNADDPEAVVHAVDIAIEFRKRFQRDVVLDMVCYRRYGHNEGDEPSYTQPILYQKIKAHASVARLFGDHLVRAGKLSPSLLQAAWVFEKELLSKAYDESVGDRSRGVWTADRLTAEPAPRVQPQQPDIPGRLQEVVRAVSTLPEGFEIHPKLKPVLKKRAEFESGRPEVDWAGAEMLAFGMVLIKGVPVRLSGQDSGRGTFSQRHAVLADHRTGKEIVPLNHISKDQARIEVIDSLLSENAVMGFEFGYSVADPSSLVLWEGQFGDFANGAQVIIDQFISGSEQKWNQRCGLVLLLPHGQEGQGPEHSSARLERFLTLCAEENLRVVNLSTPAQYYHLLRRQVSGETRKPLIVMSPKSLLRHPKCLSSIDDMKTGSFQPVLDDAEVVPENVQRVVMASGKILYELLAAREKAGASNVAIVRLEQYYPFPVTTLGRILARYPKDAELVWMQEEPRNMGAWRFVREQFLDGLVEGIGPARPLRYIGRRELASPAPGSHRVFHIEQDAMVAEAVRVGTRAHAAVS